MDSPLARARASASSAEINFAPWFLAMLAPSPRYRGTVCSAAWLLCRTNIRGPRYASVDLADAHHRALQKCNVCGWREGTWRRSPCRGPHALRRLTADVTWGRRRLRSECDLHRWVLSGEVGLCVSPRSASPPHQQLACFCCARSR